jgi:hypothetical protein
MPKPRIARCPACEATSRPCNVCRAAHRRVLYLAQKQAIDPAYQPGRGGRPRTFPRCDACLEKQGPCWACQRARMDVDPEYAAKVQMWNQAAEVKRKERECMDDKPKRAKAPTRQPTERRPSLGKAEAPRDRHEKLIARQAKQERREPREKCGRCMAILRDGHVCRV